EGNETGEQTAQNSNTPPMEKTGDVENGNNNNSLSQPDLTSTPGKSIICKHETIGLRYPAGPSQFVCAWTGNDVGKGIKMKGFGVICLLYSGSCQRLTDQLNEKHIKDRLFALPTDKNKNNINKMSA
ncbi:hypothetical protein DPX16_15555, partial [Anabarilius grahami]